MVRFMKNNRVLVVGDVMLDRYSEGTSYRISPEAPVPVILNSETRDFLGGAGNLAANLTALGMSVDLIACVGSDRAGEQVKKLLFDHGVSWHGYISKSIPTTVKNRIVSNNQQIARLDYEYYCSSVEQSECFSIYEKIIDGYDIVIFSDYNKGVLCDIEAFIQRIKNQHTISLADPKLADLRRYNGLDYLKPNKVELLQFSKLLNLDAIDKTELINYAYENLEIANLIVTLGNEGCVLKSQNDFISLPADNRNVYDVTGAGDSFLAGFVLGLVSYAESDLARTLSVATKCASIAVKYNGTKIVTLKELEVDKSVFTNGCFDIVHVGHLHFLQEARKLGKKVIIGLNSDESIKRIKGSDRPINDQESRKSFLLKLGLADEVIIFDEDTPINLIMHLNPDVLVKGGDYRLEQIVGADHVLAYGGEVKVIPYLDGFSTTKIIEKVKL